MAQISKAEKKIALQMLSILIIVGIVAISVYLINIRQENNLGTNLGQAIGAGTTEEPKIGDKACKCPPSVLNDGGTIEDNCKTVTNLSACSLAKCSSTKTKKTPEGEIKIITESACQTRTFTECGCDPSRTIVENRCKSSFYCSDQRKGCLYRSKPYEDDYIILEEPCIAK